MSKDTIQKQIEEAVEIHKPVIKKMEEIGYGLLKDGDTFYQVGMELEPRSGITFSMRQAYAITQALSTIATKSAEVTENTSDGYHTFKELYEFRKLYNACLFKEFVQQGHRNVHKSIRHHDGELCFGGGWFIVMATLPDGQISNHYEMKDWDLFPCEEREKADEWDGHTSQDVVERLTKFIKRGWNT